MTPAVPTPDLAAPGRSGSSTSPPEPLEAALVSACVRELVPGSRALRRRRVSCSTETCGAGRRSPGTSTRSRRRRTSPGASRTASCYGLGASDMKGGVAVMIELARAGVPGRYLFFTREEIPVVESPARPRSSTAGLDRRARGSRSCSSRRTASSTRAASGTSRRGVDVPRRERALGAALDGRERDPRARARASSRSSALEPLDVELDGLVFREVRERVRVEGGIASNVVPAAATSSSTSATRPAAPVRRPRRGCASSCRTASSRSLSNSPSAPPALTESRSSRQLRDARARTSRRSRPWTPVAQFAEQGIDAINYGPGATRVRAQAGRAGRRSRTSSACFDDAARRSSIASGDAIRIAPTLAEMAAYPFVRLEEARRRARRAGRRRDRLRQGRSERADRPDRSAQALIDARARARAVSARRRACPSCARRRPAGATRALRRRASIPTREIDPDLRLEGGDLLARAGARRSALGTKNVVVYGEPAYPVYERGALFAGARRAHAAAAARERLPARSRRRSTTDVRDRLGQLSAQPDRCASRRSRSTSELAERAERARLRDRARTRRTRELWFDEPPASGARRLADRSRVDRLPDAEQAFVDDRLPLRLRRGAAGDRSPRSRRTGPTVGTAPQEFVQRASVVAWNDERHVEETRERYAREARRRSSRCCARKGWEVVASDATMYLWVVVGRTPRRVASAARARRRSSRRARSSGRAARATSASRSSRRSRSASAQRRSSRTL